MAETSKIEWTEATWNPWIGCDRVSPGCAHCYAGDRWAKRVGRKFWGNVTRSKTTFRDPLKWKKGRMIFVCSLSDFFHPDVDPAWRAEAWEIIRQTPHHTYQILTKRPGLIELPWGVLDAPWLNVWIGTSVENQRFVQRAHILGQFTAAVKWISAEPLLGPVTFAGHLWSLDWMVIGGESGPKARPMKAEWVRQIIRQCREYDVPVFVKQLSQADTPHYKDRSRWASGLRLQEMPK